MPQRWNDREGRFDVEADGDFDRNRQDRGYGYDASRRRDPERSSYANSGYDRSYGQDAPRERYNGSNRSPSRGGSEFLRAAQQGTRDYGAGSRGYESPGGYGRVGGHDFGGATGDYGSSGYSSRTADYGDERYFDHHDRDQEARERSYRGAYGNHDPYRAFGPGRRHEEDRSWFDKARDEVSSWMGDQDALHRREADGAHRGRGPKGYRRSDERIREDVSDRLTDDSWLNASDIEVSVSDGDVTLTGSVRSREDKKRAEALAESVTGVDNVQNNLRIDRGTGTTATSVPLSDPL
ncbi:BON domain-containing protein [Caulobacter sp.]|uniref:BON domain-containing protein n=1 Tax=Caulobacter sp. TaxID=78 RepID=UPI001B1A1E5B|nr:BON domain-containing protein [Caulobacter sp.]MBO9543699.1 BON domain-containing protein [Caulobacter sp.]